MSRRPSIETKKIKSEFSPNRSASRPQGYVAGAKNKEVIGMDGRNDWFRCNCRECGKKMITRRREKSQSYFKCTECGAWHHVNKGFFNIERFETNPINPEEFDGELYHWKLQYMDLEPGDFYGSKEYFQEKTDDDFWEVAQEPEKVDS